jgi:hypothetical protein
MQRILTRQKKLKINRLNTRLDSLKTNYVLNSAEICVVEKELKIFLDNDLRDRMRDMKVFECLNAEKATPLLVSLGKKTGNQDSLDIIKGVDGSAFLSDKERSEYIRRYYEDLYRIDNTVGGTIEDFLGPVICNHLIVTGSKLSDVE